MAHLNCSIVIPAPVIDTYDFFTDPSGLPSLLKGKVDVDIENASADLQKGSEYCYIMTRAGISQYVRFRVEETSRGNFLTYRQIEGIFRKWVHTQKFSPHGSNQTLVTDTVDYELPFGLLGHLLDDIIFKRDLSEILQLRLQRGLAHFENLSDNEASPAKGPEKSSGDSVKKNSRAKIKKQKVQQTDEETESIGFESKSSAQPRVEVGDHQSTELATTEKATDDQNHPSR
ncbi:MAG: hypothetical protein KDD35_01875 [Bdellovibrionales bacterium]|nr:hypothetical protein [Bdellovibrionales bacterium]